MPHPVNADTFTPKSAPLLNLLGDIHRHKIALPDFQRPWVWEPEMVRDLTLSVAYHYPAGSLLTMPVKGGATFALRPFEGAGETLTDKPDLMILDGQQRLTSLYQALYRLDGVHAQKRIFYFYLDVAALMDPSHDPSDSAASAALLDKSLFYVSQEKKTSKRVRYDGLVPRYELTTRDQEVAAGALPLGCLFDVNGVLNDWKEAYQSTLAGDSMATYKALDKDWKLRVQPWLDRIREYRFPVVELHDDVPLPAICHIFEKVNSTGVPLNVFDLATATLWTQGFRLNKEWDKVYRTLQPFLPMQPLAGGGTAFLQGLSLLATYDRKRTNPRLPVTCRRTDLLAMSTATVKQWWPVLMTGYKDAASFMVQQGILSPRVLPYSTLLTPLAAILGWVRHTKGEAHVGAAWPKLAQWYWCATLSQRYSSMVETVAAQDMEQVLAWLDGGSPPEIVRTFTFRSDLLEEISSIRNVIYKGVLCLLAREGARDFGGGGTLSMQLFYDSKQDHHHIFPTDALDRLGVTDWRRDTLVNKTLINAAVNRSIGGNAPSAYITALGRRLDPNNPAVFEAILESHQITPAVLARDDWDAFRRDRRDRLRILIYKACGGNVQPFTNDAVVPDLSDTDADVLPEEEEEIVP